MQQLKIAHRLYLIVGLSAVVMIGLALINWTILGRLSELQDRGVVKSQMAAEIKHDSNLGAQAYRVIADTYINRNFDEVQKKWLEITKDFQDSFAMAAKAADTAEKKALLDQATAAFKEIRTLYEGQYLELSKSGVPQSEMGTVDDAVDKQIDKFDDAYTKFYELLTKEATGLDAEFDVASRSARVWIAVSILLGGLMLVALTQYISRSITSQLGMELAEATVLAHKIAEGDLTHNFAPQGKTQTNSLASAFDHMLATLRTIVVNVRQGSDTVATSSTEISQGNNDLSERTEQQAAALEETASSMEQLGSQVVQNAERAREANALARKASGVAVAGGEVVGQVVETMKGITEASRRIGDIIGVIDGIAFQTNILALNAAVEAARAGEQGRGFAVVASEVRSLAGRSAEAAKEIKSLISASVERVEQGTTLVDRAGVTMAEIVASIQSVTETMGAITTASAEQSAGVAQVGEAVHRMDQTTQQNAALVEQIAAAAASLKTQAQDLVRVVATFKLQDGDMLQKASVRNPYSNGPLVAGVERRRSPAAA